ncbi:MAG: acetyl-CoA carboxylase biotin carboxylase subunit [Bryobacteraceae bacterium]|jgi:acetyl-CoA carboxylase biotin carboxylase subunit
MFRKVLVANRGEIAVRVIRALRELGIPSVAVFSDADRAALHVRMADEAAHIGPAPSSESYLRIDRILEAARSHGAEAIHPGYGFLSENAEFAAACEQAGIVFVGPSAAAIRALGSKTTARQVARSAGVEVVPGTDRPLSGVEEAREVAAGFGYPVFLKAALGGGGKGLRRVDSEAGLAAAWRDAVSESERSFRSAEVYIEKLIERPRHIEIQVFADCHSNAVHLGERECSIQRRHQKVIEECPSPLVACRPGMREAMGEAALKVVRAAGYTNAGTVEFLVDRNGRFYFLEMNTRLQVEHPITELVTGLDLVHLQLRVAAGEPLGIRQQDVRWNGHAIECRVYAEDPYNHFYPSPGTITQLSRPAGPGIRIDSGAYLGWTVPLEYDPLVAKLAVWAGSRPEAIRRMERALDEYTLNGIKTTLGFYRQVFASEAYRNAELHTGFIEEFFERNGAPHVAADAEAEFAAALVAAVHSLARSGAAPSAGPAGNRWLASGREELLR